MNLSPLSDKATRIATLYGFRQVGQSFTRSFPVKLGAPDITFISEQVVSINSAGVFFSSFSPSCDSDFNSPVDFEAAWHPGGNNWQGLADVLRAMFNSTDAKFLGDLVDVVFPGELDGRRPQDVLASLQITEEPARGRF